MSGATESVGSISFAIAGTIVRRFTSLILTALMLGFVWRKGNAPALIGDVDPSFGQWLVIYAIVATLTKPLMHASENQPYDWPVAMAFPVFLGFTWITLAVLA